MSTDPTLNDKPVSKAAWKKNRDHSVMCPSGSRITIRIPDIPKLVQSGVLPQNLIDTALGRKTDDDQDPKEMVKQEIDFLNFIVTNTVIDPVISEADLDDVPYEDKEFIVQLATRRRDIDVEGEHIAGLSNSEKFRRFRQLGEFSTDVAGL